MGKQKGGSRGHQQPAARGSQSTTIPGVRGGSSHQSGGRNHAAGKQHVLAASQGSTVPDTQLDTQLDTQAVGSMEVDGESQSHANISVLQTVAGLGAGGP